MLSTCTGYTPPFTISIPPLIAYKPTMLMIVPQRQATLNAALDALASSKQWVRAVGWLGRQPARGNMKKCLVCKGNPGIRYFVLS